MDSSVICTWRAYLSSDFDGGFVMNSLGNPFQINAYCSYLTITFFDIKGTQRGGGGGGGKYQNFNFLAHLAKGNVSFCHHLASVVRRLLSVNFSLLNLLL
jgi:hypothetical protein